MSFNFAFKSAFASRILLLLTLCALCGGMVVGCAGIRRNPDSPLPGNAPASWEGQMLGVPVG